MFAVQEYEALQSGRGFVQLSNWTSLVVTGSDRLRFLNSFCTNDVIQLAAGKTVEAFITNVKGKCLGHGWFLATGAEIIFIGPPGQGPRLVEHFDKYVIREDVQFAATSSDRAWLLTTCQDAFDELAPDFVLAPADLFDPLPSVFVTAKREHLPQLRDMLLQRGLVDCKDSTWDALRIEAGLPLYGVDFDADQFPQEVGRDRVAISFTKGCYLGQETVARIDALGHVNQQIVGVKLSGNGVPTAGVELLHAGKRVGHVTSATLSPRLGAPLGLALVRRECTAVGSRMDSDVGTWEVVGLPVQ